MLGEYLYERNGSRLSDGIVDYPHANPTLGEHNETVLVEYLGLTQDEVKSLEESGALD